MQTSSRTDKLATAMSAAQGAMSTVRVSSASLWDVCLKPLSASELSLTQTIELRDGVAYITTSIEHTPSGQKMETRTVVQPHDDGRIGPMIEGMAFQALLGLLALAPPNEDPAASVFTR